MKAFLGLCYRGRRGRRWSRATVNLERGSLPRERRDDFAQCRPSVPALTSRATGATAVYLARRIEVARLVRGGMILRSADRASLLSRAGLQDPWQFIFAARIEVARLVRGGMFLRSAYRASLLQDPWRFILAARIEVARLVRGGMILRSAYRPSLLSRAGLHDPRQFIFAPPISRRS